MFRKEKLSHTIQLILTNIKVFMIFFDGDSVDVFLNSAYNTFTSSNKDTKFQGYVEVVN